MRHPFTIPALVLAFAAVSCPNWAAGQKLSTGDRKRPSPPRENPAGPTSFQAYVAIFGDKPAIQWGEYTARDLLYLADSLAGETSKQKELSIHFKPMPVGSEKVTIGWLHVDYSGKDAPNKEECIAWARERLQRALVKIHELSMEPLNRELRQADRRRAYARALVDSVQNELYSLREREMKMGIDVSPEGLRQQLDKLTEDRLKLRVELAGLKARHQGMREHVEDTHVKLQRVQVRQREVLEELTVVVKLREQELASALEAFKAAVVGEAEVREVKVQLSTARADLAQRRLMFAREAGSELLDRLNQQLVDVQIGIAAAEAQLRVIEETAGQLGSNEVRTLVVDYGRASRSLENALAEEQLAAVEFARLERALAAVPEPKVMVIRREDESK